MAEVLEGEDGAGDSGGHATRRRIGMAKGDFEVPEDFDAPLPGHVLDEFER